MKYISKEAAFGKLKNCKVFAKNRGVELQEFLFNVGIKGDVVGPFVVISNGNIECVGVNEFYANPITEYEVNDMLKHIIKEPIKFEEGKIYVLDDPEYSDCQRFAVCAGATEDKFLTRVFVNRYGSLCTNLQHFNYWPIERVREANERECQVFDAKLRQAGVRRDGSPLRGVSAYWAVRFNPQTNELTTCQFPDDRGAQANWDFNHDNYFYTKEEADKVWQSAD